MLLTSIVCSISSRTVDQLWGAAMVVLFLAQVGEPIFMFHQEHSGFLAMKANMFDDPEKEISHPIVVNRSKEVSPQALRVAPANS